MATRCSWPGSDPLYIEYHDREWGVPVHDDRKLFEFLILDGAQAGLSWLTILKKRENYRKALDGFDPVKVAAYDETKIHDLLNDAGIVRNRRKIESAVTNARAFLDLQDAYGSFDDYVWRFVGGVTRQNAWKRNEDIPVKTPESEAMSKDLVSRGFRFAGPTICYAFMQAAGLVNDHLVDCFRHAQVQQLGKLP